MGELLAYGSTGGRRAEDRGRWTVWSWVAAGVSVWGAWVVMRTVVEAAKDYLWTCSGFCGVRSTEAFQLEVVATLTLLIPGCGWWLAERVGGGIGVCRGAFYAALAAWVTAEVMAHRG